jgi:hypothetical protein
VRTPSIFGLCVAGLSAVVGISGCTDVGGDGDGTVHGIAVGSGATSCALDANDAIFCWGFTQTGITSPPSGAFKQISLSSSYACGVRADQTIECWGSTDYGQADAPEGAFEQVAAAQTEACALSDEGAVVCWGQRELAPPDGVFVQISGDDFFCGVSEAGSLVCWDDQLVDLSTWGPSPPPQGRFAQAVARDGRVCLLAEDGDAQCWWPQYEPGDPPGDPADLAPEPGLKFQHIAGGSVHSCGIQDDGTAACWGSDFRGSTAAPAGVFAELDAGRGTNCGITSDDAIVCWGENGEGQATPP